MRKNIFLILLSVVLIFALSACGGASAPAEETGNGEAGLRLAAIFPGTITDADYNSLGYLGITTVESDLGVEIAYSETVAVPDVDRVMREYIDDNYNIIFTHGGQFFTQTLELAAEFPEVNFIAEADAAAEDLPPNVWVMVRNMERGAYGAGVVAGMLTETGTIGYIGGLTLPFSYAEVHAMEQALADNGMDVTVVPVWAGDFNDPAKARELTDTLISEGADVIVSSLNLGTLGVFEAAKNASSEVLVIAKYTDKSEAGEDQYVTSMLYDFAGPLTDMVSSIESGETSGNYHLGFDTGITLQLPLANASDEVNSFAEDVMAQLAAGDIEVEKNSEPIE
ncbi:MAG: BMP family ABC transporter substrate-binding protein [Chloroflexi bacterium]|nr:MAG: BMP family ABC transporter substrate-binding protein [Chloroflexota bacterium]MBL1196285.1 BMP family ABC transporter substrate-binding protein [Chloroflexota bacterium]NOH13580.1 BMP family protein [Chloroflexota bacterium]